MSGSETKEKSQTLERVKESKKYKVILLNDNKTTFEFVSKVLQEIFHKSEEEAEALTMQVHFQGSTIGGVYSKSVAEVKKMLVHEMADEEGYPFRCEIEEE